jgi:hypothetical protein
MDRWEASLRLKGVVLLGESKPIALVAVDWIGVGGEGHIHFRETIAQAIGTSRERVSINCLHQHDAPRYDLSAETLLAAEGLSDRMYNVAWVNAVIRQAAAAAKQAADRAEVVTHIGFGEADVKQVASNRRILGTDGKVLHVRYTTTRDPVVRAFPEGVIDPGLKTIRLFQDDRPLVALTYYATHPQSYYRTGTAHPDFPGMARDARQEQTGVTHIHFNGAGGNIGAGKYNNGAHENRAILASRVAEGMADSYSNATDRIPIDSGDVDWVVTEVQLPPADHLNDADLSAMLKDTEAPAADRISAAKALAFLRRCHAGAKTEISCLRLGRARILHMPGELFVEYQLQAIQMRPDLFVAMAAYGDYAPGYIGTKISYSQGGYETSQRASRVAPSAEGVLVEAMAELLAK